MKEVFYVIVKYLGGSHPPVNDPGDSALQFFQLFHGKEDPVSQNRIRHHSKVSLLRVYCGESEKERIMDPDIGHRKAEKP